MCYVMSGIKYSQCVAGSVIKAILSVYIAEKILLKKCVKPQCVIENRIVSWVNHYIPNGKWNLNCTCFMCKNKHYFS